MLHATSPLKCPRPVHESPSAPLPHACCGATPSYHSLRPPPRSIPSSAPSHTCTAGPPRPVLSITLPHRAPLLPSPQPAQWGPLDPFEYHPQRGLYFHEVAPGLICGTQPRSGHDVAVLAECGVTHILNLQVWGVVGGRPYYFRASAHTCGGLS